MHLVSEADADPRLAHGYERIRQILGSTFVPSIYRVLAGDPPMFDLAVSILPSVAGLAQTSDFAARACTLAAEAYPSPDRIAPGGMVKIDDQSREVLLRYRNANPVNLLLALALLGTDVPEWPHVLAPPLPARADEAPSLASQIETCHGGVLLPGVWRELLPHASTRAIWELVLGLAHDGQLSAARQQMRSLAESVLVDGGLASSQGALRESLRPEFGSVYWFPTGIATMVVEVEWILTGLASRE